MKVLVLLLLGFALSVTCQAQKQIEKEIGEKNENGKKVGEWKYYAKDEIGKLYIYQVGSYLNGQKNGPWKEYSEQGELLYMDTYEAGKLNGLSETYRGEEKTIVESKHHQAGMLHGPYMRRTHDGGEIEKGHYWRGKQHGEWFTFNSDGKIISKKEFKNGKEVELTE